MFKFWREAWAFLLIKIYYLHKPKIEGIVSVYFHYPSKELFEKILKWFISHNYRFVSIAELDNIISEKVQTTNLAFISFDDGWKSNLELIEVIEKYKVPVTIFIPTQAVVEGNYWWEYATIKGQERLTGIKGLNGFKKLSEELFKEKITLLKQKYTLPRSCITLEELQELDKINLITIGSHTVTHPILKKCSYETQLFELTESKKTLSQWLNRNIEYLAYPNGDYNDHTIKIAREINYKLCFTINPGKIDAVSINPFIISRNALYEGGGYFENISKILGIWQTFFNFFNIKQSS